MSNTMPDRITSADFQPEARVIQGDALAVLRTLEAESVHCVVTSPPYWGLRSYSTEGQVWGGDAECGHEWGAERTARRQPYGADLVNRDGASMGKAKREGAEVSQGAFCLHCNAWRGELGLEPTPALYVEHIVQIFREVRRVLRSDGTLFLNIGDSYVAGPTGHQDISKANGKAADMFAKGGRYRVDNLRKDAAKAREWGGLKPKDKCMIPAQVALALQQPYHVGPIKRAEDRAWLAGLIDADGSMGIRVQHAREGRGTNESFISYLAVSQSDTAALQQCIKITGMGKINLKSLPTVDRRGINSNRAFFTWRLDGQQASKVIRDIYPYLLIKKLQAQIVCAMNESLKWGRPSRSLPVPPDVMTYRRRLYECVKLLNQRSEATLPPMPEVEPNIEPGFYLRQEIVWCKRAPMPESTRDRPTTAHEMVYLFSKQPRYFYDQEAERVPHDTAWRVDKWLATEARTGPKTLPHGATSSLGNLANPAGRNLWSYWLLSPDPYSDAHFAVYPRELARRCISLGTSAYGCCAECGAPWARVVEREAVLRRPKSAPIRGSYPSDMRSPGQPQQANRSVNTQTVGWKPTCTCNAPVQPCTVLDPFSGAGTSGVVAVGLGRAYLGIELSPIFHEMSERRIAQTQPALPGLAV